MNRTLTIASFRTVSYVNGGRVPITIPPNCEGDSSTFQAPRQSSRPPRPNTRTQNKNKVYSREIKKSGEKQKETKNCSLRNKGLVPENGGGRSVCQLGQTRWGMSTNYRNVNWITEAFSPEAR